MSLSRRRLLLQTTALVALSASPLRVTITQGPVGGGMADAGRLTLERYKQAIGRMSNFMPSSGTFMQSNPVGPSIWHAILDRYEPMKSAEAKQLEACGEWHIWGGINWVAEEHRADAPAMPEPKTL